MRKKLLGILCTVVAIASLFTVTTFAAQSTNKAWSTETAFVYYEGNATFKASFTIPSDAGYGLTVGKHVKKAYVNLTRDGDCVTTTGERCYTYEASSTSDECQYSVDGKAWDSLNPWASKTMFWYGWFYF